MGRIFHGGHYPSGHIPEHLTNRVVRFGSRNPTGPTSEAKEPQAHAAEKTNQAGLPTKTS